MDPLTYDLATDVLKAFQTSDWFYLASLSLALITLFLRPRVARTVPLFNTDRGGVAFVALLGAVGGVLHGIVVVVGQFISGMPLVSPFTPAWWSTGAKIIGGAIATYAAVKKLGLLPDSRIQSVEDAMKKVEGLQPNVGVEMMSMPEDEPEVESKDETPNEADKSGGGAA